MPHSPRFSKTAYFIPGFQAVQEALVSGRLRILEVWLRPGKEGGRAEEIRKISEERGIQVRLKEGEELDTISPGTVHQGIFAIADGFVYSTLEEMMKLSLRVPGDGLLLAADHITDEGNLGALARAGAFFGAHGLILPKDRSAAISPRVMKRSAGALLHLPVARVVNLGRALGMLREAGFWIIGTAGESQKTIYDFDWKRNLVLVLGSEHTGLGASVRKRCDQILGIPGSGTIGSLNVSVAAGVILSEISRQRSLS